MACNVDDELDRMHDFSDVLDESPAGAEEPVVPKLSDADAKRFWSLFLDIEEEIVAAARKGKPPLQRIGDLARSCGFLVEFRISVSKKNAVPLPEYANSIELILSANWNRHLCDQVELLYKTRPKTPAHWAVSKYCITTKKMLSNMVIMVGGQKVGRSADIKYALVDSKTDKGRMDIVIYASLAVREGLFSGESGDAQTSNSLLIQLLHNIMGEYHVLHTLGEIIIARDAPDAKYISLRDLRWAKEEMDAHSSRDVDLTECARCAVAHYNSVLRKCSRCRKVVYCCVKCQRADFPSHKAVCA